MTEPTGGHFEEGAVTDPFWAEVTRLLPDVDVVLLPNGEPAQSASSDSRFVAAIRARRARDEAHQALAALWARLLPSLPLPPTCRRAWRAASDNGELIRVELIARHSAARDADVGYVDAGQQRAGPNGVRETLAAARAEQVAAGVAVDERRWVDAGGLRLVTEVAGHAVELYGVLSPATLTVTVLSPPVQVPVALGRQLVAGTAEQVATAT
jgi:hypothetical protein